MQKKGLTISAHFFDAFLQEAELFFHFFCGDCARLHGMFHVFFVDGFDFCCTGHGIEHARGNMIFPAGEQVKSRMRKKRTGNGVIINGVVIPCGNFIRKRFHHVPHLFFQIRQSRRYRLRALFFIFRNVIRTERPEFFHAFFYFCAAKQKHENSPFWLQYNTDGKGMTIDLFHKKGMGEVSS